MIVAVIAPLSAPHAADSAPAPTGEAIYRAKCADCHGSRGEGVAGAYESPLVGDRSVAELTQIISDTMPEGEPEQCAGPDAALVAQYIYDAFYSEIAQARNRPATIEFSRLTVRQYEHSVADLFRSFRAWGDPKSDRGLKAQYFNSRGFSNDKRVIERTDRTIDFDFGEASPDGEKIDKEQFAIKWEGSLLAPETGVYDFIVRTDNGVKLYVNNDDTPVIDAWVRSGDGQEYRGSTRLLGGRMYPLRLEFFKFKDPRASIRLSWKPPHLAEEVIPARCLTPEGSSPTFVVTTPFPPDDRSTGFVRGTSVSPEWHEAATYAAIEAASYATENLRHLSGAKSSDNDRQQKLREFCTRFAERAFRRPLSDDDRRLYVDRQFDAAPNPETAVKRVVLLVLTSPRFLYRELGRGTFDDFDAAAWLAFSLWDSLPDQQLTDAARKGQLRSREQIQRHAERMLSDPRARAKVREFMHHWLHVDQIHEIAKDGGRYPEFSDQLIADLRTSLDLFLDEIVWSDSSDFRQLLLSDHIPVNGRMAAFYGIDAPPDSDFAPVSFQPDQRAGVLSHPFLLAAFAYDAESSPIHRGVWLSRNVLGRVLNPPPIAVSPVPADVHAGLTTRERVDLQTSDAMCAKCHNMINPLGFSLEHFDAVGRFRETEHGKPVNAAGRYVTRDGETVNFNGVAELARFLADSPEAHRAFTEQLFQHLAKQPIQAFGQERRTQIREHFAAGDCNIRKLIIEIATASTLAVKELEEGQPTDATRLSAATP